MQLRKGRANRFRPLTPLAVVLAIALVSRLLAACVVQWFVARSKPPRLCVFPDTEYYWLLARTIRAGTTYEVVEWGIVHHLALRTPGYPLFLAACQSLFGESTMAVRVVQAALGTASVWLVYRLTQRFDAPPELGAPEKAPECRGKEGTGSESSSCPPSADPPFRCGARPAQGLLRSHLAPDGNPHYWTAPLVAAVLAAIDPYAVAISELLLSEALFIPLMLFFLCGLASLWGEAEGPDRTGEHPSARRRGLLALATGAAAGAAVLTRPSFALFPLSALLVWVIACCIPRQRIGHPAAAWRGAGLVMLGIVLVMSPWWIRNARIYGRFVPTSVWFGASLYDGLNRNATGASDMKFRDEPEFRTLSELDQDKALARRAWEFARANPARVLQLAAIKLVRYWSPWLNAEEYRSTTLDVASAAVVIPFYLLLIAGAWDRRGDRRALVLLAGPLLYFCAVHLVFVSSVRYRISAAVAAMPLAAIGFRSIAGRVKAAARRA
jgi:4-amino-4-deoxy-L-arabinose transferase-like glycosyltransferase